MNVYVGTTKGEHYAVGKKMTDTMLEILNLDKTESVSIDIISNHDFTEVTNIFFTLYFL